jgi:hypothetical protein
MKLISMTDFVLGNNKEPYMEGTKYKDLVNYAKFLKEPLKLEMFVPCYSNGNLIEKPNHDKVPEMDIEQMKQYWDEWNMDYDRAKENVLFEGFNVRVQSTYHVLSKGDDIIWLSWNNSKTVESLMKMTDEILLTIAAIKKLGLDTSMNASAI